MKIAILVNESTMDRCTGRGCLNAFNKRLDAFAEYDESAELIAFTHTGGDMDRKIEKFIKEKVDVVHVSTCARAKYPDYDNLMERLSENFKVVGYTHGSDRRKELNIKNKSAHLKGLLQPCIRC